MKQQTATYHLRLYQEKIIYCKYCIYLYIFSIEGTVSVLCCGRVSERAELHRAKEQNTFHWEVFACVFAQWGGGSRALTIDHPPLHMRRILTRAAAQSAAGRPPSTAAGLLVPSEAKGRVRTKTRLKGGVDPAPSAQTGPS